MPSLKDLKNRITSVKSTRKITKAMQMVAAAKLRRAQDAAEAARPYADKMADVVNGLAASVEGSDTAPRLLAGTGSDQTHLLVVMTAERGLCGGFNSSIVKKARGHAQKLLADGKTVKIMTVGRKGREQLKRDLGDHLVAHVDLSDVKRVVAYTNAEDVAKKFSTCSMQASSTLRRSSSTGLRASSARSRPRRRSFPAVVPEDAEAGTLYDYEPSEEAILADLLPRP